MSVIKVSTSFLTSAFLATASAFTLSANTTVASVYSGGFEILEHF